MTTTMATVSRLAASPVVRRRTFIVAAALVAGATGGVILALLAALLAGALGAPRAGRSSGTLRGAAYALGVWAVLAALGGLVILTADPTAEHETAGAIAIALGFLLPVSLLGGALLGALFGHRGASDATNAARHRPGC